MYKPEILHITSWYPNETDPQLGIFIKKHILQTYSFANNIVLAIIPSPKLRQIKITEEQNSNTKTIIGYYPTGTGKYFRNYRNYTSCLSKMLNVFLEYETAPDLIHCHVADKSIRIATKVFKNTPYVVTEHWSGYLNGKFDALKTTKKKKRIFELNAAKHILTVGPNLKEAFIKMNISTPIDTIDNVIEVTHLKNLKNKDLKFLIVADLVDQIKNISGVLKSFSIHLNLHSSHTLHILGGGKDLQKLETIVTELNLEKSVYFIGRLSNSEVLENYANHDVLIVNSTLETYSMVTAEALASGIPVISTKCGGPEQFIQEGINGLLTEIDNVEFLAKKMGILSDTIHSYSPEQVRSSVENRFSKQQIENTHKKIVFKALGKPLL